MIKVLFFARIREALGLGQLDFQLTGELSLDELRKQLIAEHGEAWREALMAENVITAVNQEVVGDQHLISDGDEVAFYPPVTGG